MIFDSHAHYDDEAFDEDREELLSKILPEKNVCGIMNVSSEYDTIEKTLNLCEKYEFIYGAAGIHPSCAKDLPENYLDTIKSALKHEKMLAVGEIGLDYYHLQYCDKDTQKKVFHEQLRLASDLDLPVILHDRDAHGDMLEILKEYKLRGVMHCYSGSLEMAKQLVKMGYHLGIGGVLTFKNAKNIVEVAREIPMDKLLLETDCPYLSPVPFRGKRNDSSLISFIARELARIKNMSEEEVLAASRENVFRVFGIS